jgi:hypothetical protein
MARLVPNIMAEPTPCNALRSTIVDDVGRDASKADEIPNIVIPERNMRFLPYISAILPNGIRNMAEASRYARLVQLMVTASNPYSEAMLGNAMLKLLPLNGVRKLVSTTIISIARLLSSWLAILLLFL